jgi:hypothetical protein
MDVTRELTEYWKIWLCSGAVLLIVLWPRMPRAWAGRALGSLVLLAAINYTRFGTSSLTERLDAYDLLHYYVNAKYFDELGYYDLYPAMLYVDRQNEGPFFEERQNLSYMAQDDAGHHFDSVASGVERGAVVQARFSPARWVQFEHDVLYLQRTIGCRSRGRDGSCVRELNNDLWRELINDHGFNGTTGWVLLARPFTVVPVEGLKVLAYLDVLLLGGALALVAWAYGSTTAQFTTLFLLVTYSTRWPYVPWVFLRYDWVALLLAATALLKKGRPGLAGVAAGVAAVTRLFPALWMWGPFTRGLSELAERRLHRPALVLAAGFALSVAVLQGAATLRFGSEQVGVHLQNMRDHNSAEQLSSRRIGLALALATEPWRGTAQDKRISDERRRRVDEQQPLRYALAAAGCVAMGFALRRRSDDEAFGYGFIPFFLITTASYYYYVARATLVVLHASDLTSLRNRVCLGLLFGLELLSNLLETQFAGHRMLLIGCLAWGLLAYVVVALAWLVVEQRATAPPVR